MCKPNIDNNIKEKNLIIYRLRNYILITVAPSWHGDECITMHACAVAAACAWTVSISVVRRCESPRRPRCAHTCVPTPAVAAADLITATSQGVCASVVRRVAWLHTESILLITRLRQLQSARLMTLLVLKVVATVTWPIHRCRWPNTCVCLGITTILVRASAVCVARVCSCACNT